MPWEVKKKGDQYCVYKVGSDSPIKGGCHDTKSEADDHKKALYANVDSATALKTPVLVTIPNVPIVEVGIDYPAMTGDVTFTREDLVDAVSAAMNDPAIPSPRLKLTMMEDTHGMAITEPSFGRVTNLRFDEQEQTVYGDYEGVPSWLADILPAAYPGRSIEGYWGVQTNTGHKWSFVIGAVQLLGVEWPGCGTLEDLPLYYGDKQPETVELKLDKAVAARGGGMGVHASVNVDDVRRQYYELLDSEGNFSWWCKAVLIDPDQLVVEDEYVGKLYLVDFKVKGDKITFSDPVPVKIEYVPLPQEAKARAELVSTWADGFISSKKVAASYASAQEAGRVVKASQTEGGSSMDDEQRKKLAAKLSLGEDATEEEINKALLTKALTETQEPDPAGGGEGKPGEGKPEGEEGEPGTGKPADVGAAGEIVSLDKATYELLLNGAKAGVAAAGKLDQAEDEEFLLAALKVGKFPPSRLEHWRSYMKSDREGARKTIEALSEGLVPVEARGVSGGGNSDDPAGDIGTGEAYPSQWFPEVAARKARLAADQARGGARVLTEAVN